MSTCSWRETKPFLWNYGLCREAELYRRLLWNEDTAAKSLFWGAMINLCIEYFTVYSVFEGEGGGWKNICQLFILCSQRSMPIKSRSVSRLREVFTKMEIHILNVPLLLMIMFQIPMKMVFVKHLPTCLFPLKKLLTGCNLIKACLLSHQAILFHSSKCSLCRN